MKKIRKELRGHLTNYLGAFHSWFERCLMVPINTALGNGLGTPDLNQINDRLKHLRDSIGGPDESLELDASDYPLIKRALVFMKRQIHEKQENLRSKTPNTHLQSGIDGFTNIVDELLNDDAMRTTTALEVPRLTNYLTLKVAYQVLKEQIPPLPEPAFDEKFGILQAPSNFLLYLKHFRMEAWLRHNEISVAYIDIDDFKQFNSKYTETVVDQIILPAVMHTIEAHMFSHGYAFRFGGDEYVLLMPNMSNTAAVMFLSDLQSKLDALELRDISEPIRVSIGLSTVSSDSSATNLEIQALANEAKNFAKENGKNCISYNDNELFPKQFHIVSRKAQTANT